MSDMDSFDRAIAETLAAAKDREATRVRRFLDAAGLNEVPASVMRKLVWLAGWDEPTVEAIVELLELTAGGAQAPDVPPVDVYVDGRSGARFVVRHCPHLDYFEVRRETAMSSTLVATFADYSQAVRSLGRLALADRDRVVAS